MSNRDLSLALRLYTDATKWVSGLTQARSGVHRFVDGARSELESLKTAAGSVKGQFAQLGLSVSAVAIAAQSAKMDKSLTQIGQTAGMSTAEVSKLRQELFSMASQTGQPVDDLQQGFNNAVQAGLQFKEALPVIHAVNQAMGVTGASADTLTKGLTVAATAYDFDLSKPNQALLLLDKMTVAGRLGNAELENLSDIFARVGVNSASANLSFDKTLGFIEGLSQIERQPERLGTLADSTLRIFTNAKYMSAANQATGVKFFDAKGARRDALDVLADIKKKYDTLKTDKDRSRFVQAAFGQADLDTIKGLRTLLGGDMLTKVRGFSKDIGEAGGALEHDLPAAISNAVDQTGRLKAKLREAADSFAQPINDQLQSLIRFSLDKKENGGLGLSGEQIIGGTAATVAGLFAAGRYGGKAVSALAKKFGGTAAGVAEGKLLEKAVGVTPVFVVNMPGEGISGTPSLPGGLPGTAADTAAKTTAAGGILGSGTLGSLGLGLLPLAALGGASWLARNPQPGESTWLQDQLPKLTGISEALQKALSAIPALNFSSRWDEQRARNRQGLDTEGYGDNAAPAQKVSGEIQIKVSQEGVVKTVRATSSNGSVPFNVYSGLGMVSP